MQISLKQEKHNKFEETFTIKNISIVICLAFIYSQLYFMAKYLLQNIDYRYC